MSYRLSSIAFVLLLVIFAVACGGNATATAPGIETVVAGTFLTMTIEASEVPSSFLSATATPPATNVPVEVLPVGRYGPYPGDACQFMRESFEQALGIAGTLATVPYEDFQGGVGQACRIQVTGNGATMGLSGPHNTLVGILQNYGWTEDLNYGAAGPQTVIGGFRRESALGILTVHWDPSADAICPQDQPIGVCDLTPEQKIFDITFDLVQPVVYVPIPDDACENWRIKFQPLLATPLVTERVAFSDLASEIGTACRLRAIGTGVEFVSFTDVSNSLGEILVSNEWVMDNGADGPTGTAREYILGNQVIVTTVGWHPSPDANCPNDQPISTCSLLPAQMLYTITIDLVTR